MSSNIKVNYIAVGVTLLLVVLVVYRFSSRQDVTAYETVSLKQLLSVSLEVAELGGRKVAEVKQQHINLNAESKGLTDEGKKEMKTDGDMMSHRAIMAGLELAFPALADRIVSEEHDKTSEKPQVPIPNKGRSEVANLVDELVSSLDVTIWVDPLDATQEYTENLDEYVTVMVCVAVKGKPVIGVIHRPMESKTNHVETVWAWVGKGTSGNMLKAADEGLPKTPSVIMSRSHTGDAMEVVKSAFGDGVLPTEIENGNVWPDPEDMSQRDAAVLRDREGSNHPCTDICPDLLCVDGYDIKRRSDPQRKIRLFACKVITAGGSGYKTVEVVRGHANLYAHVTKIKKWDICSGNAILNALGGSMKTLKDAEIDYSKEGNPANTDGLLASVYHMKEYMDKLGPAFAKKKG